MNRGFRNHREAICHKLPQPSSTVQRRSPYGMFIGASMTFAPALGDLSKTSSTSLTYT